MAAKTKTRVTVTSLRVIDGIEGRMARMEASLEYLREANEQRLNLLEQILEEAKKTNGRINKHDVLIAENTARAEYVHKSMDDLSGTVSQHEEFFQRIKGAWLVAVTVSAAIGATVGVVTQLLK